MRQEGTGWAVRAQRPGVMPAVAATTAQSCGTKRDPSPHVCQCGLCQGWGGDTLHSPQVGTGVEREGDSATPLW